MAGRKKAFEVDLAGRPPVTPGSPVPPEPPAFPPRGPFSKIVATIRQNAILRRMQEFWNAASVKERRAILKELLALRELAPKDQVLGLVALGRQSKTLRGAEDVNHATKDWLGQYFTGPAARTLLEGMITAAERSLDAGLPVANYWVAGDREDLKLKVAVAVSDHQVTVLLVTPPELRGDAEIRDLRAAEPLWVIRAVGNQVVVEQVRMTGIVKST
jgi:hypothetical protein